MLQRRRLEDRIHALLQKAVDTEDRDGVDAVLNDLRAALNEHVRRLREMASSKHREWRRRITD
ncbi:MAG: hypothetical protein DMG81_20270 [Acidobacteria bacterium]|nr:MAG: hypothetical protein DMG81_20270 [Acidobacteriota bacterium]